MRFNRVLELLLLALLLALASESASAFSFDFGDDDDDWRYYYWAAPGAQGRPWIAPNGAYFYPRLPYFERNRRIDRRQSHMAGFGNATDELGAMLYGNLGFDRARAISLARRIEAYASANMVDDFHPGAIAAYRSNTTLALWGNPETFRRNAQALKAAAAVLADQFEQEPTSGAVSLPQRGYRQSQTSVEQVKVSPQVWKSFNAMTSVCDNCHRGYRGIDW
jgi:cytochrome c556